MLWLIVGLGLMGCADSGADSATTYCTDIGPPLDWETYGEAFFDQHCTGCHSSGLSGDFRNGAPEGVDFDTLEGAQENWDAALTRVENGHPSVQTTGGGNEPAEYTSEELESFSRYIQCSEDVP